MGRGSLMQLHPMPEFGSFTLLLALALSVYTLVMGGVALWRTRDATDGAASRLGETARRAGIASFVALSCAAFALVWAWLLSAYGFVLRVRHKVDVRLTAFASTILAGVQIFFLLLLNFAAPPFALGQGQPPADGVGLNPLL